MLIVSACLAGVACRYNGLSCPLQGAEDAILELITQGQALPLCPETLGGLSVPRPPCEICHGRVLTCTGEDCTDTMVAGVAEAMRRVRAFIAETRERTAGANTPAPAAILKARSPSCGAGRIYDGTFTSRLVPGDGLWTAALRAEGIAVYSEESPDLLELSFSHRR